MIFILVHLLVMAAFAQGPDKEVAPPLSVCELVAHRSEYNGRLVTVRGEAKSGAHGGWLTASSECQYQLVTRGITWPNDIYLAYPDNRSRIEENHANFEIDWKSIQKAEEAVRRSGFNRQTDHIIETYVGRFVTYVDLENRVN